MNGKISILMVMGFSALFAIFGRNMLSSSNVTVDNYSFYFNRTQASQIARSGVYLVLAQLNSINPNFTGGYTNKDFAGGKLDVSMVAGGMGVQKVTSIGRYGSGGSQVTDTVITSLGQRSFAGYGNYYNHFAVASGGQVWAATGDVFDGRFHANDFIRCYGNPEFTGAVTSTKGVKLYDSKSNPIFHVTPEIDAGEIPIIDTAGIRTAAFSGGRPFYDSTGANKFTDVYLNFKADGTVDYKSKIGTGSWSTLKNVPVTTLTSNGVIYIQGGQVTVQGVLKGNVSVVATKGKSTNANAGRVIVPQSLTYSTDPLADYHKSSPPYSCQDVMGLVAEKEVFIPFDATRGNIDIHASIFAQNGGLKIENYSSYGSVYNMNLVGGVIGNYVEPTADYAWSAALKKYIPIRGYSYVHKYDSRFDNWTPPYFPKRRIYTPLLWYTGNVQIPVWG